MILMIFKSGVKGLISNTRASSPLLSRAFGLRPSDRYQTVEVLCAKCQTKIFKYKKKNGTKSKLVKLFKERIVSDPYGILATANFESMDQGSGADHGDVDSDVMDGAAVSLLLACPKCKSQWGRPGSIAGNAVFKCIGGKLKIK